jgi:hypothetical protein
MNLINSRQGQRDPRNIFVTAVTLVITVYVVFAMVKAFVESDPSFGKYGWPILGALVIGIIAFLRSGGLFGKS